MALASQTFNDADLAALSQLQQSSIPEVAKCVAAEDIANNGKSETQQHLIKMQTEIAELGKALDKYVGPQHDIEVTSTCSRDAIAIVLETTELAEEILSYSDAKNLLVMQQVDQRMRDTIESSMKLQKQMILRRQQASEGSSIVRRMDIAAKSISMWTAVRPGVNEEPNGTIMKVTSSMRLNPKGLLRLGSRARRIQICQPPITSMFIFPTCCSEYSDINNPDPGFSSPLKNGTGLTLGDMLDAVGGLRKQHVQCWDPPYGGDYEPFEPPRAVFRGEVKLADDDPKVIEALEMAEEKAKQETSSSA